jgi:hypothetical protein
MSAFTRQDERRLLTAMLADTYAKRATASPRLDPRFRAHSETVDAVANMPVREQTQVSTKSRDQGCVRGCSTP